MTAREKKLIAVMMANYAPTVLRADPNEPSSWRCALRRIGCSVVAVRDAGTFVASFDPQADSRRYPVGEVVYNTRQPKPQQVRGLAHEFGHALCQLWIPQFLFDCDQVVSYHDDPRSVRHQIARLFERMMVR